MAMIAFFASPETKLTAAYATQYTELNTSTISPQKIKPSWLVNKCKRDAGSTLNDFVIPIAFIEGVWMLLWYCFCYTVLQTVIEAEGCGCLYKRAFNHKQNRYVCQDANLCAAVGYLILRLRTYLPAKQVF